MHPCFTLGLGLTLGVLAISPAAAVDYFWTNTNGGAYDEPSNWTPFSPPATQGPGGASDTVNFDLGVSATTPYFVSDMGRENSQLIVHNDSLLLSVFVNHRLSSTGGANPSVIVGAATGDDAFASFFGGTSTLDTQVVRIANAASSAGSVRIDNLEWNSTNFRVGYAGDGVLTMDSDATLNSTNASLAHLTGSTGHAVAQGTWNISDTLVVGRQGAGYLEVSSGGLLTSNTSIIGDRATGAGEAFVNSTWITNGALTIGDSGRGQLLVTTTFGNVSSGDAYLGRLPGSSGTVVVGHGTWTTQGRLSIGGDSTTNSPGGEGLVEITGGLVTAAYDITLFPAGQISLLGGSLDAPIMELQPGAIFDWAGGQLTVDTFNGSLSNPGGIFAAREGSNSVLVSGEYSQGPVGVLKIGIHGPAANHEFDSVIVGNTAFLGGTLEVELADGFLPAADETYVILDALNLGAGSFSNAANGERLFLDFSRGSFIVNYGAESLFDPSQVVLSDFQPAATGDFDFDGDVDGRDFLLWQRGETFNPLSAADLAAWQENYGAPPLAAVVAPLPEPHGVALIVTALLTIARRRRA
jgi:T5SS/PEP-CTERM-associated repeat protein